MHGSGKIPDRHDEPGVHRVQWPLSTKKPEMQEKQASAGPLVQVTVCVVCVCVCVV